MQPILLVAIVAVAIAALSTGYLSNDIDLWTQQFGVGEEDIGTPVTNAGLTINIQREFDVTFQGNTPVTLGFNDLIVSCEFRSPDKDLLPGTKIFCKLLGHPDINIAQIVAEGDVTLETTIPAGSPITIPIDMIVQNDVDFVHNIVIVFQDPPF